MIIRIYETDYEGHPVECTGEFLVGASAIDIVEAMKLNPFTGNLSPVEFMRHVLNNIGQKEFPLSRDPDKDAESFLRLLIELKYAEEVEEIPDYFKCK